MAEPGAPSPGRGSLIRQVLRDAKLLAWLVAVRLGLSLIGYRRMRRILPATHSASASPHHALRTARRIEALARFVPGASCLTQALALSGVLARQGHATTIRIGVSAPDASSAAPFEAHAWVECAGHVVLGHRRVDLSRYAPLANLT
jgi:hypothetical protein